MTSAPIEAAETPRNNPRRDAVSWALSAATLSVLAVGLLVIRSTRSEPPTLPPRPSVDREESVSATEPPPTEQPIVALPTVRDALPDASPSTAQLHDAGSPGRL